MKEVTAAPAKAPGNWEQTHSLAAGREKPSITMATSRASLKASQESLLFVETGEHSPKASIPLLSNTSSACLS